jgi:hypothetical protein
MTDLEGNVQLLKEPGSGGVAAYSGFGSQQPQSTNVPHFIDPKNLNTLDEPVLDTLKRDVRMIWFKLKYVLHPKMQQEAAKELRNWDLWGPLLLCLTLATFLSLKSSQGGETIFGIVFVVIWAGAAILAINAQLLGGKISFFQSVCVLGYCVFPINLCCGVLKILEMIVGGIPFLITLVICSFAYFWSTYSSVGFIKALVTEDKKVLAAYPVMLFYLFLTWFVVFSVAEEASN